MEGREIEQANSRKVIERIGWEDIKNLYATKKRIKRDGILLMLAGIATPVLTIGVYLLFDLFIPLQYLIGILFASATVSAFLFWYGRSLFMDKPEQVFSPAGGRYTVFKKIKCIKCGNENTVPFESGDYVGKEIEKECKKCEEKMKVIAILANPEKRVERVGMPILPGAAGSMSLLDKLTLILDRIFPISSLVTKLLGRNQRIKE